MKRKEEIEKAAMQVAGVHPNWSNLDCFRMGFREGAKFADKTMLERAENYLRSKFEYRPILKEEYIHGEDYIRHRQEQTRLCNEFITAFRQAMKGGAE